MSNQIDTSSQSDEELRKCLKPNPSNDQVLQAINETYKPSEVSILKELESYDDRNYLVVLDGVKFLAKVYNGVESAKYIHCSNSKDPADGVLSSIHLYSFIFEHLKQEKYSVQAASAHPIPGKEDTPHVSVHEFPVTSEKHSPTNLVLQLLTWVEGSTMSSSPILPIETLADAGRYLGKVCIALDDLTSSNEDARKAADRYHAWDGKNALDLEKFVYCIPNEKRRDLVKNVLNAFKTDLVESGDIPSFRKGILQGDFNDANIIMNEEKNVAGVIDFGDTTLR
jgi:Ser/Thr protein kinase RdoA (MazF antagonist)